MRKYNFSGINTSSVFLFVLDFRFALMDCSKYLDFLIPDYRPDCLHKCYAISSMDRTPETTPELKEPAQ